MLRCSKFFFFFFKRRGRKAHHAQTAEEDVDKFRSARVGQRSIQLALDYETICQQRFTLVHFLKQLLLIKTLKVPKGLGFTSRLRPYLIFWRVEMYSSVGGRMTAGAAAGKKNTRQLRHQHCGTFTRGRERISLSREGLTCFLWLLLHQPLFIFALFLRLGRLMIDGRWYFVQEYLKIAHHMVEDLLWERSTGVHESNYNQPLSRMRIEVNLTSRYADVLLPTVNSSVPVLTVFTSISVFSAGVK